MDFEKLSERARGFIQAAQTIALRENHQRVVPDHLLKALLDDDQGLAANLIKRAGGDPAVALAAVDRALAKEPKVEGGQMHFDTQTAKVLAEAEKLAKQAGDTYRHRRAAADGACRHQVGRERCAQGCRRHRAGAERRDQRHPQGPDRRHRERRAGL